MEQPSFFKCYVVFLSCLLAIIGPENANGAFCVFNKWSKKFYKEKITIPPMKWQETPAVVKLPSGCSSNRPLGMSSRRITKQQLTASSEFDKNHGPDNGRLDLVAANGRPGSWTAKVKNANQWIQVDFLRNVKVTKVATQGRQDANQFVKMYKLAYRTDGSADFKIYKENNAEKVFNGNTDQNTVVTHSLAEPITARYIQIKPVKWHGHISMRAEFYGCIISDRYEVMGRIVHMDYVEEHLRTKKGINFSDEQELNNNIDLRIMADTIYIKGTITMYGIASLKTFSRRIVSANNSRLSLKAPRVKQDLSTPSTPGSDGDDGRHGFDGTRVEIYADSSVGYLNILSKASNGNSGQNGANGARGPDNNHKQPDISSGICRTQSHKKCYSWSGSSGRPGGNGGRGGNGGKAGNGGNGGTIRLYINRVNGKIDTSSCRGYGGKASQNGLGGTGGSGGFGGYGYRCKVTRVYVLNWPEYSCDPNGRGSQSPRGRRGARGPSGNALLKNGSPGIVFRTVSQYKELGNKLARQKFPVTLMKIMTRYAEDLVWANDLGKAKRIYRFVEILARRGKKLKGLKKFVRRRLGIFGKKGFDRFGRNLMFAPLMKWETYKNQVIQIRNYARDYETAYNSIQASVERGEGVKKILKALPKAAILKLKSEKKRLSAAKKSSNSEKKAYVRVGIKQQPKYYA